MSFYSSVCAEGLLVLIETSRNKRKKGLNRVYNRIQKTELTLLPEEGKGKYLRGAN